MCERRGQRGVGHLHWSGAGGVGLRLCKLPLCMQSGPEREKIETIDFKYTCILSFNRDFMDTL